MFFRHAILFLMLAGVLQFGLPVEAASSQSLDEQGVQVITLSSTGHERANAVSYSPDGKWLAVGTSSGIIIFNSGTLSREYFIHTGSWARSVAFSSDSLNIAGGLFDNTARLWRISDGSQLRSYEGHSGWVRSVALSPDGQTLATASDDNTIRLWNTNDGSSRLVIGSLGGVRVLALSPDGKTIAVGLQDTNIQLRQTSDGALLRTLPDHTDWVRSLAFSPDGRTLASGAFDATVRLWDVGSGQLQHTLSGHLSSVLGVVFSPDGSILATGSVDKTVRLWQVNDGSLDQILVGHDGFVYSVTFSPDGKKLVSGAEDNTVRLWDLNTVPAQDVALPETSSDCRACHHPMSNTSPPAVVEMRCDVCHINGIGFNWCPNFPRSPGPALVPAALPVPAKLAGVSVPGESLGVTIFSPANGETLYSHSDYVAPVKISGRVLSAGESLEGVDVRLEIWSGSTMISSLHERPGPGGIFDFLLGINPSGYMLIINDPAAPLNCAACHDDFNVQAYLPAGDFRLVIIATTKDGVQAVDERWINVDVSQTVTMDVAVRDAFSGRPVNGLTIQASTRLYDWRGRISSARSNENGNALLGLEVLSQAFSEYKVVVPAQVVDGVFYSSQESDAIVLEPDMAGAPHVTFEVHAQLGQINGTVINDDEPVGAITIWAFDLPGGPGFHTETSVDGSFSFKDLPVSEYLVFPDLEVSESYHWLGSQQIIDLVKSPSRTVEMKLNSMNGSAISGDVAGQEGEWLPFSWLDSPGRSYYQADVETGKWMIRNVIPKEENWVVSAPGYFSQEIKLSVNESVVQHSILLERRPDTEIIAWGDGEIVIPDEAEAFVGEDRIDFVSGWIWGSGHDEQPLILETSEAIVEISGGKFALQRLPGEIAWFFLLDGQAVLHVKNSGELNALHPGNMIALLKDGLSVEVPYGLTHLSVLSVTNETPVNAIWKPSLTQYIQNQLSETGIGTAQLVTFITYIIAISSLGIVPLLTVGWWLKRRKVPGEKHE